MDSKADLSRVSSKEMNSQKHGKSAPPADIKPQVAGKQSGNPTKGGGIVESTKAGMKY